MIRVKKDGQVYKTDWAKVERDLLNGDSGNGWREYVDSEGNVYRVSFQSWTKPKNVMFMGQYQPRE